MDLLKEAAAVGFLFAIIIIILAIMMQPVMGNIISYDLRTFAFMFLAGALGHLAFEAVGANKYYCEYGNACKQD